MRIIGFGRMPCGRISRFRFRVFWLEKNAAGHCQTREENANTADNYHWRSAAGEMERIVWSGEDRIVHFSSNRLKCALRSRKWFSCIISIFILEKNPAWILKTYFGRASSIGGGIGLWEELIARAAACVCSWANLELDWGAVYGSWTKRWGCQLESRGSSRL